MHTLSYRWDLHLTSTTLPGGVSIIIVRTYESAIIIRRRAFAIEASTPTGSNSTGRVEIFSFCSHNELSRGPYVLTRSSDKPTLLLVILRCGRRRLFKECLKFGLTLK